MENCLATYIAYCYFSALFLFLLSEQGQISESTHFTIMGLLSKCACVLGLVTNSKIKQQNWFKKLKLRRCSDLVRCDIKPFFICLIPRQGLLTLRVTDGGTYAHAHRHWFVSTIAQVLMICVPHHSEMWLFSNKVSLANNTMSLHFKMFPFKERAA